MTQVKVKDVDFCFDQQTIFTNVTIGGRACATSVLLDADDLERIGRVFLGQAKLLRGD
jgi:hypothetical protein